MKAKTKNSDEKPLVVYGTQMFFLPVTLLLPIFLTLLLTGCTKNDTIMQNTAATPSYQEVDLVMDTVCDGARVDANLSNAWGIAIGPSGAFWIAANHTGKTTIYDRNGNELLAPVNIPFQGAVNGGSPTGVVYNNTSDFLMPGTSQKSLFIYVAEDGTVTAWNAGSSAITVADNSAADAVYKGVAIGTDGADNFLYAANFKGGTIDVFDKTFHEVFGKSFTDPSLPAGFAPFNIQNIDGMLYVAYAKQEEPDKIDDEKGVGNGYVDIFKPDGSLVKRLISGGMLNSPWGMAVAPEGFGLGQNVLLIGNFGDGKINIYDSDGNYKGQLMDGSKVISIDGLWEIVFPKNNVPAGDPNQLFFAAGPDDETHGLFGYIKQR
ncbi:TIGR03118 family protein [Solitalea longa]|uniref:TIGR03118 family protein n=1 Tax=Solitalea longa TaxID=2079460 RepID=A0A2S4ZZK2_9SPHI|nr:TIGR03118 family protein [Solitalea longa]POY35447.1 TIGR03118 family protein [Solitalea longa]